MYPSRRVTQPQALVISRDAEWTMQNATRLHEQPNVTAIRESGLCMGCGTCEPACPVDAIRVIVDKSRGIYLPTVDAYSCTQCGFCLEVCPGAEVDIERLSARFVDGPATDPLLGSFTACYIGHASSQDIRYHSASGGLITALLCFALENRVIDGALVLDASELNALENEPRIANTTEEVISSSGSRYCPSATNQALRHVLASDGHFAVVGLPCQIHAVRKWEAIRPRLTEKIVLHLGLFCANNNTYLGTEYFLRRNGIDPAQVREIRYRAEGWPGKISVTLQDDTKRLFARGTSERHWRRRAILSSAFHYDFTIPRCLLCPDQTSELADLSLGDPWLRELLKTERIGKSLVIVRNRLGADLLARAAEAGVIELEETPIDVVQRAQNYAYKAAVGGRIRFAEILGRSVPDYGGRNLAYTRADVLSALSYAPSYFSYHRSLWPFLRFAAVAKAAGRKARNRIGLAVRSLRGVS